MKPLFYQKGVGLIEVMVAAIVFAVGIAALVKLQGNFFKYSSAANGRSIAMSIAEEKMEDLRGFQVTDASDGDIFDFTSIGTNTGGRCTEQQDTTPDACTLALPSGNVVSGNITFTRNWTSTAYYYNGTTLTTTPNGNPAQKLITVNVSWTDSDGTAQTASLNSIINSNATAAATGAIGNNIGGSGEKPAVYYTPQAAPDVIAQPRIATTSSSSSSSSSTSSTSSTSTTSSTSSSGGGCAIYTETDKPDPTIDANSGGVADNNLVSFSTTTYKDCGGGTTPIALKKEEFFTLNCTCELTNQNGEGYDQEHNLVTKAKTAVKTGQSNGQNELCDTCCRDHHENTTGDHECDYSSAENRKNCYTPFRNDFSDNDHNHYASSSSQTPVTSGTYLEACRLKRVNGYWNVVSDWNLVGLNVFVRSDLTNSGNVTSYQNYVAETVNAYVSNSTSAGTWTVPTPTTPSDNTQMMARGIFVDYMAPSEKSGLIFNLTGLVPQEVPFYEYHVSGLADWKTVKTDGTSSNTSTASPCPLTGNNASANKTCVDSPTVAQIANANQNQTIEKGVFRVGSGTNQPTSDIKIVAEMKESNSGVAGTVAINPLDTPIKSASVTVPFSGSSGGTTFHSISLASTTSLSCPNKWGSGNNAPTYSTQYASTWNNISLSCSPSSGDAASSCINFSSTQSSVNVTAANTGNLQCVYSGNNNIFTCPSSIALTVSPLNGTKTCSISMSKSGSAATCALVCQ